MVRRAAAALLALVLLTTPPLAGATSLLGLRGGRKTGRARKTAHLHDLESDTDRSEYSNDVTNESGSGTVLIYPHDEFKDGNLTDGNSTTVPELEAPKSRMSGSGRKL